MPKTQKGSEKEEDELIEAASTYNYDYELEEQEKLAEDKDEKPKDQKNEEKKPNKSSKSKQKNGKAKKIIFTIFGLVVLFLLLFVVYNTAMNFFSKDKTVALVNNQPITESTLLTKYAMVPSFYRQAVTPAVLLNQSIIEELLFQEATKKGYTATMDEVNGYLELIVQQSSVTVAEFADQLKEINLSLDEVLYVYQERLVISKYLNETILNTIEVTDTEINNFYNSNLNQFIVPDQVRASHILVESEESANEILERINNQELFADLAIELSIDTASGQNGGDLGFFGRGMMVPEFEDIAFSLDISQISNPVKSQFGYHIIYVTDKRAAGKQSVEEVSPQIKEFLLNQKQQETLSLFVSNLLKKADIVIVDESLKKSAESDIQIEIEEPPLPPAPVEEPVVEPVEEQVEEPQIEIVEEQVEEVSEPVKETSEPIIELDLPPEPTPAPIVEEESVTEVVTSCNQFDKPVFYYASWCSNCNTLLSYIEKENLNYAVVEDSSSDILKSCLETAIGFPQLICGKTNEIKKGAISTADLKSFLETC